MTEKHLILDEIDPVVFYGVQNANLRMIKSLYPKLRLIARDNVMYVQGEEEMIAEIEEKVHRMVDHCVTYNRLSEEDILEIVHGSKTEIESGQDGTIVYSTTGKPIRPRNENQQKLVEAFYKDDLIFATGPAGTGKTYISIALAVSAFKKKKIRKIIK